MIGRTVLITGANTGIGRATAHALAAAGARVFFAGRSEEKTRPVVHTIARATGNQDLHFLALDLEDLDSVKRAAETFLARNEPLHVLINNAGLARATGVTKQGFERTFGVNHLGHFLLTLLLKPALEAGAPARVVVVASRAHERFHGTLDFSVLRQPTRHYTGWPEYQVSKLANVLFAKELARRWDAAKVHSYSLHPGVIASDIWRSVPWPLRPLVRSFMRTPEEGARASVHCASAPEVADHNGRYYDEDGRERRNSPQADDPALARTLWEKSVEWVRPWLGTAFVTPAD
ncbi:MAG: SDR family oxidoreductase [Myxococcota bacterium]|jgi:retinol dehydrogenase-12